MKENNLDKIKKLAWDLNIPLNTIWFHYYCNQRCNYCLYKYWHGFNNASAHYRPLTNSQIEKILSELKELGGYYLDITGGEPLTMQNFTFLLLTARKLGFRISMTTNGSLFTKFFVDMIAEIKIELVRFSINGAKASTHDKIVGKQGHFVKALKWIKFLKDKGISVEVNYTVIPQNFSEVEDAYNLFHSLGIPVSFSYNFIPFIDNPLESQKFWLSTSQLRHLLEFISSVQEGKGSLLDELANGKRCNIGKTKIVVGSDGIIYPCELVLIPAGNANFQKIKDIWGNSKIMSKFRELKEEEFIDCKSCKYTKTCLLFCVGNNFIYTNDITKPYPYTCRISKEIHNFITRRVKK